MLLQHAHAAKLLGADVDAVHGAAAPGYVPDREFGRIKLGDENVPYPRLGVVEEVGFL